MNELLPPIRPLPPHTVHHIAAGEVLERPASALKELIENALDAKATSIRIRFVAGGLQLIEIEDDGHGIAEDSLPYLFQKHATSKLQTMEDLRSLRSYGFRGEALYSMGIMSEVEVLTGLRSERTGRRAAMQWGQLEPPQSVDRRLGTKISVKGLFAKTPARRKFLKTEVGEKRALLEISRRYAAAFHDVSFEIYEGLRCLWKRPAESLQERLTWAFDGEDSQDWREILIEAAWGSATLNYVKLSALKSARPGIWVFINGRPIKDAALEFAIRKAFETFCDRPRDLSALLKLNVSPEWVDPNIHPRKLEVGLACRDEIVSALIHTVRGHLQSDHWRETDSESGRTGGVEIHKEIGDEIGAEAQIDDSEVAVQVETSSSSTSVHSVVESQLRMKFAPEQDAAFTYWGSIDHTYLVVNRESALLLFDQHALHERILYEDFLRHIRQKTKIESQRLLFPIRLRFEGAEGLLDRESLLEFLGYEIRMYDDAGRDPSAGSIYLVATPSLVKRGHEAILQTLLQGSTTALEDALGDTLATMACHAAVRAHDFLPDEEARRLISDFFRLPKVGYCPHGRPTFVHLTIRELEKFFHRVQ